MNHAFLIAYLIVGCIFLYLALQAYRYVDNYDSAVRYVAGEYQKAYANLTCCTCVNGLTVDRFSNDSIFGGKKPVISINISAFQPEQAAGYRQKILPNNSLGEREYYVSPGKYQTQNENVSGVP